MGGKRSRGRGEGERLGRDDWLDAAFDATADGGLDAVRVLTLAGRLGVTRGSFYWHFADHAALVAALLERWHDREREGLRMLRADIGPDPEADLLRLLDAALSRRGPDLRDLRFELALRAVARHDPSIAAMLQQVDTERMALFEAKFLRLTGEPSRATELAALFYVAVSGANQAAARPGGGGRTAAFLRHVIAEHVIASHAALARRRVS